MDSLTVKKRDAAVERQRQIMLAAMRAENHLGYSEPSKEEKKRKREMKRDRGRRKTVGEDGGNSTNRRDEDGTVITT